MQSAMYNRYAHYPYAETKQHRRVLGEPGARVIRWNPEVLQRDMTDMAAYQYQLQVAASQMLHRASDAASPLLTDLVAYWKLDEASGVRGDSHGTSPLTDNNTVGSAAGKLGNAASFVAANSEYLSTNSDALNISGALSISLWVRPASASASELLIGGYSIAGAPFSGYGIGNGVGTGNSGKWTIWTGGTGGSDWKKSVANVAANVWTHLVVTIDASGNGVLYINGSQDTTFSSFPVAAYSGLRALGSNSGGTSSFFSGRIDEVGIWKRLLTSEECTLLWNSGAGLTYPFL